MTILGDILAGKRTEVEARKAALPAAALAQQAEAVREAPRGFARALAEGPKPRVIAELKRRSPSRGEIRPDFDVVACAKAYFEGGAAALSVLTDERWFGGRLEYLAAARSAAPIPILRKDFLVDLYQVDEARVAGADAVLLIAAALDDGALRALKARADELGLDVLVEVHDEAELERALAAGTRLLGVNNRDLRTFHVDLAVTERLARRVPPDVLLVAESGIFEGADVRRLAAAGAGAFLVGEFLMRAPDPGLALRKLREAS